MRIDKKQLLSNIFVVGLIVSNILSVKLIRIGNFLLPCGVLCYAITFLMADVIGELYGKEEAKRTVRYGLLCQILSTTLIGVAVLLPCDNVIMSAFNKVFGIKITLTIASLVAYLIAQTIDVTLFHKLRAKFIGNGAKQRWIWNNISTMTSQAVDTAVFLIIGFGLGLGLWKELAMMFVIQYAVKLGLALIDTPLFIC